MRVVPIVLSLALFGCDSGSSPPPPLPPPPVITGSLAMDPNSWDIQFSREQPPHPLGVPEGWYFDFSLEPVNFDCNSNPTCGAIHYITQPRYGKMAGTAMVMMFNVVSSGSPVYQYKLKPDNTCESAATVRLFFQGNAGDNRWWSNPAAGILKSGMQTLLTPLDDPSKWSNAGGIYGNQAAVMFEAAKSGVARIGMTFGGGCFFGHGVNVLEGSGTSRFIATKFMIQ